ncbi:hypothetical protein [Vibrio anguillarum]|nr:hypothetical protein [Vibrio anguillarum]
MALTQEEFSGFFSKEYKDCGNGYYYLLIKIRLGSVMTLIEGRLTGCRD